MATGNFTAPRALIFLLCSITLFATSACTVCTEQIVDETTSPDHTWTTRTTVRDCGNLATPTTNIYLQRADSRARLGEIVRHTHTLNVAWDNNMTVRITCAGCGEDVRIARQNAHGISIILDK